MRVYIGTKMYKAYPKGSKEWCEFESHRHKEVHMKEAEDGHNNIVGPIMS